MSALPGERLCRARADGDPARYPIRTRKLKRSRRENWWLWLEQGGRIWLEQRPESGVWAGLWTLPLFEDEAGLQSQAAQLGAAPEQLEAMPRIEHALTHFDWVLHPRRAALAAESVLPGAGRWVAREELAGYALPAPLKRLLA